jgi:hypothetical protein
MGEVLEIPKSVRGRKVRPGFFGKCYEEEARVITGRSAL